MNTPLINANTADPPPCKLFNKKKAITCYKLLFNFSTQRFDHFEQYRITNETPGEYYVFPIDTLQKERNRHISYHKSGAFHWREEDGKRIVPVEGEADARRAEVLCQAMAHIDGRLDGYCISKGRDVSDSALSVMIEIMDGYIIPPLKTLGVDRILKTRKSFSIPLFATRSQFLAERVRVEEERAGNIRTFSVEEMTNMLRAKMPNMKLIRTNPKPATFRAYSEQGMLKLISIARAMVIKKMDQKPKAFWAC